MPLIKNSINQYTKPNVRSNRFAWILRYPSAKAYSYIFPSKESATKKNLLFNNRCIVVKVRLTEIHEDKPQTARRIQKQNRAQGAD